MAYLFDTNRDRVACTLERLFLNVDHATRRSGPFTVEVQADLQEHSGRPHGCLQDTVRSDN